MRGQVAVVPALLVLALTSSVLAALPSSHADLSELPKGPWVDVLLWSEEPDTRLALEQIKNDHGDFFMLSLHGAQLADAVRSPKVLTYSAEESSLGLLLNPNEQQPDLPWNPFTDAQIREAMNWLIDRSHILSEIYDGFGAKLLTPFGPGSAEYPRQVDLIRQLEREYAANFGKAEEGITQRMTAHNATIGPSGFWEDSMGRVIDLQIIARIGDERRDIGNYVAEQLRAVGFMVTVNPSPSSDAIPLVYGGDPSIGAWHAYTEGWAFRDNTAWEDLAIWVFHACVFEPFCARFGPPGTYSPPPDFDEASEDLAFGRYGNLEERRGLIRDLLPRVLSEANYRLWLARGEAIFAANDRLERFAFDRWGGPWSPFTLRTAKLLPGESGVDLDVEVGGELRVLNFIAFNDAWNPWVDPAWLYDAIQRRAIGDPGMWPHPSTGEWMDFRVNASVETAGPERSMPVPREALHWNASQGQFLPVGTRVTAGSKVTTTISDFGKWHNGMDITMDDVIYGIAAANRRAFGDVSEHDSRAATTSTKTFYQYILKGIEVVDANTLVSYIDFWHVDDAEIAAAGFHYLAAKEAPVPWEIQEAALQSIINGATAIHEETASLENKIWLDLSWYPKSIAAVDTAFTAIAAENAGAGRVPQGMSGWITQAEATARYTASQAFWDTRGHWYASNGPFVLRDRDAVSRETFMIAFREGYPFTPDKWDHLITIQGPDVVFGSFPESLVAGTGATLSFSTTIDGEPADPQAARWFVRKASTNIMPLSGAATRLSTGEYEVQLLSTLTHGLESGKYELLVIVTGTSGSEVHAFPLEVTSQFDFLLGLIEGFERPGHPLPYPEIAEGLEAIQVQIELVKALGIAALILTVAAAVLGLTFPILVLRRLR